MLLLIKKYLNASVTGNTILKHGQSCTTLLHKNKRSVVVVDSRYGLRKTWGRKWESGRVRFGQLWSLDHVLADLQFCFKAII
jgi:hypothetical protein